MNTYKSEAIRNVAILGHGGSGKTTLVEAIALTKGIISRQGRVEEGNTISDYDKEEIKRTFSISTSLIPVEHDGIKINFLDCPGYFDFVGEVEEALDAAGAAIIVVNAKAGVEVGTIKAWEMCEKKKLPRMFFVTAMDDPNANFAKVLINFPAPVSNAPKPLVKLLITFNNPVNASTPSLTRSLLAIPIANSSQAFLRRANLDSSDSCVFSNCFADAPFAL